MVRPRLCRRISSEPNVTYFKPRGIPLSELEESILTVDELEAVKLKDFEGMEQEECAKKMNISQPTFHRLIVSARKKVADAIVNGKAIKIEGGNFEVAQSQARRICGGRRFGRQATNCTCTSCGYQVQKEPGSPCASTICPKCGAPMTRGMIR